MTDAPAPFEADLEPDTNSPRLRLTFANGQTASMVLVMSADPTKGLAARVAHLHDRKVVTLGEQEASPDETVQFLAQVACGGENAADELDRRIEAAPATIFEEGTSDSQGFFTDGDEALARYLWNHRRALAAALRLGAGR